MSDNTDDPRSVPDNVEGGPFRPGPDDFIATAKKPPGPLSLTPKLSTTRPAIFCWLLFWIVGYFYWNSPYAGLFPVTWDGLERGEWWRPLTALFTHSDVGHLASNTPLFIIFGWYLHAFFGWRVFPGIALVVGYLSNVATIYIYGPGHSLVGASGMLYGMVALWLVLYIRNDIDRPITVRVVRAIAFTLVVMFPTTFQPRTSYLAHSAGFIIGAICALALVKKLAVNADNVYRIPMDINSFQRRLKGGPTGNDSNP